MTLRNAIASLLGAALAFFLVGSAAAADFARSADLCVLPIVRGSPGEAETFDLRQMVRRTVILPGLAGPMFYRLNRAGVSVWAVYNGTFERLTGSFPSSEDDKFAVEEHTGRIIGLNDRGEIFAADPGSKAFHRLASPYIAAHPRLRMSGVLTYLPQRRAIVFGYENSLYRLEGDHFVLVTDRMPFRFGDVQELPKLDAMLVTGGQGALAVVHGDGATDVLWEPKPGENFVSPAVMELRDPARVLVHTAGGILVFPQTQPAPSLLRSEFRHFKISGLDPKNASAGTGTYLVGGGQGLWRIGSQGFEKLPDTDRISYARLYDVPSLGVTVATGGEDLHIFDGRSLSAIPDSRHDRIGQLTGVYDLRSIGKVLVAGKKGLFELTPQRTLVSIDLPVPPDANGIVVLEMPRAQAAILLVANSAYAIDRSGAVLTLPGGDTLAFTPGIGSKPIGVVPATNEFLFAGPGGSALFRVVDKRTAGAAACAAAEPSPPPPSALCFRPIEGSKDEASGSFIDWGLSPEGDRLLVASSKGLFQIARDRSFGLAPESVPNHHSGPVALPWDGSVFIAPQNGPYRILEKSGQSRPVRNDPGGKSITFKSHVPLPSLKTVVLGADSYLGPDDTVAKITNHKGEAVLLSRPPVETPWLDGDLVYNGDLQLFKPGERLRPLVIERSADPGNPLDGQLHALPRFRSVLVGTRFGWRRLTEDRKLAAVPGLDPAATSILAITDPGRGDILLGTSEGLYRIDDKGAARAVPEAGRGAIRVLQQSSAFDGLMVGGESGLFRLADDRVVPVKQGDAATIGAVYGVTDVPWARLTVVAAARGYFVFDRDGTVTRLDTKPAGGRSPFQPMAAFAPLRGVFVFGPAKYTDKGAIYELGRRTDAGACAAPL